MCIQSTYALKPRDRIMKQLTFQSKLAALAILLLVALMLLTQDLSKTVETLAQ